MFKHLQTPVPGSLGSSLQRCSPAFAGSLAETQHGLKLEFCHVAMPFAYELLLLPQLKFFHELKLSAGGSSSLVP